MLLRLGPCRVERVNGGSNTAPSPAPPLTASQLQVKRSKWTPEQIPISERNVVVGDALIEILGRAEVAACGRCAERGMETGRS